MTMTTGKLSGEGITACDVTPNGIGINETDPMDAYFELKINVERAIIDATYNGHEGLVDWRNFYDDYSLGTHFADIRRIIEGRA